MRLYLDTSVFGGYFDEEFASETRKLFKRINNGEHQIYISELTRDELNSAPERIQYLLANIPKLSLFIAPLTEDVYKLAEKYVDDKIITEKYFADALHIAAATISRVDVLVSWNFKHMVNLYRIREYNSVNLKIGFPTIDIRTPQEVNDD